MRLYGYLFFFLLPVLAGAQSALQGQLTDSLGQAIAGAELFLVQKTTLTKSNAQGFFRFDSLAAGPYQLDVYAQGFQGRSLVLQLPIDTVLQVVLQPLGGQGPTVYVQAEDGNYGLQQFRAVDWDKMLIGAAKKSSIIKANKLQGNLAANNSRQVYAKIAGLNIWENDNSGIQLNIGGRGLSPNRSSNFNTRQNGYDISADALGYPESYYTPPVLALEGIELIRGAASLQYGTQFGGLLNFRMKQGNKDYKLLWTGQQTGGSFGFYASFNSLEGQKGKLRYYAFHQYKRGDGWRPNSAFEQHTAYLGLHYQWTEKLSLSLEQTYMSYVAQQPGGLTDLEFRQNPRQAKRPRNWFRVDWAITALDINYRLAKNTKLNFRQFALFAGRQSLGNLEAINRVDYGGPRQLIKGQYQNFGQESRIMHRYKIGAKKMGVLLGGVRLYKGFTTQAQGLANADSTGSRADFTFLEPAKGILSSDYNFPSFNFAAFAENFFSLGKGWSITPGLRYEYIQTQADGYYQDLLVQPSAEGADTLRNEAIYEQRGSSRSVFLVGIGLSYRPKDQLEVYGNISQNYRAINFNDLRLVNPNQVIDPDLQDESGFNADLGFRGRWGRHLRFDFSLFYLAYQDRIGTISTSRADPENPDLIQLISYRSNIGNARVLGLESLIEWDVLRLFKSIKEDKGLLFFNNFSILDGRYTKTANTFAQGKLLELVPPISWRLGLQAYLGNYKASLQYAYTGSHFSDASNAELVANAVLGRIPAYGVWDASFSYQYKALRLGLNVNNLLNKAYFSRRAAAYPGPGILPAEGRSIQLSLGWQLGLK
ncbi:outer membrane receptor for Fe3+-dicitrate [Saprospira grandis DSM 2844]|uniref:Outer membrane receptor for Fe3+-dicitrate n=1 Tax=Saprospira grandis DSM 2844 TaxID=694433 RepID=J1I1A7_9BACT|nr:TonB-dependent receptor [Saprospira grandis]EJF52465.1 outer membrane receptor for Fe3+-dicitrate [Saprospira grandis DSM 2844]